MSKKLIYISLFSLVLFACKKEIMTPNNARLQNFDCVKQDPNHQDNLDVNHQGGYHDDGFGSGANAIGGSGGNSTDGIYSGSPADTNAITDPNDDDDEVGGVGRGGVTVGGDFSNGNGNGGKITNTNPSYQNGN
jgi:hypothetical protein